MTIKRGSKDLFPYLGDNAPVNVYKGNTKLAGWKWASQSGKVLQFQNGYKDVVRVEVDGLSEQNAGSGKNLFAPNKNYYVNLSNSGLMSWKFQLKPNTQYTASTNDLDTYSVFFDIYLTVASSSVNGISKVKNRTITTDSTGLVEISARNNATQKNYYSVLDGTVWIQIEQGSTATAYEFPAPSPDYPIAINSLNKSIDIVSSVGGRNLRSESVTPFVNNTNGTIVNSTDFIFAGNVSHKFTANTTDLKYLRMSTDSSNRPMKLNAGKTYTASWYIYDPKTYTNNFNYVDSTNEFESVSTKREILGNGYYRYSVTIKAITEGNQPSHGFLTYGNMPIGESIYVSGVKIEIGSVATPYSIEPEETQYNTASPTLYKTNILLSESLRSIGSVKDRLFLDADGLWKVERKVGIKVFDGTETFQKNNSDINNYLYYFNKFIIGGNLDINTKFTTTHLTTGAGNGTYANGYSYGVIYVTFGYVQTTNTVTGLKTFLTNEYSKNTPFTLLYTLLTPTTETLSPEQQTYLNNIASFKGSNYVYTVAANGVIPVLNGKMKVKDI